MTAKARPFIGVSTTTPIAIVVDKELTLEPMNIVAEDGCGVPSDAPAPLGKTVAIAFRLSSAKRSIHCKAKVVDEIATTPAGLKLQKELGDDAFTDAMQLKESATSIVRREDLERMKKQAQAAASAKKKSGGATDRTFPVAQSKRPPAGFCLEFVGLGKDDAALIQAHIRASRELEAKLAVGNVQASADRKMGLLFDDPDLSDKANNW